MVAGLWVYWFCSVLRLIVEGCRPPRRSHARSPRSALGPNVLAHSLARSLRGAAGALGMRSVASSLGTLLRLGSA